MNTVGWLLGTIALTFIFALLIGVVVGRMYKFEIHTGICYLVGVLFMGLVWLVWVLMVFLYLW